MLILNFNDWWKEKKEEINIQTKKIFGINYPTKIEKIIVSSNVNGCVADKNLLNNMIKSLTQTLKQKPCKILFKKSLFKLRKGNEIGCKVTMRGKKAMDFLFRFINVFAPSIRGFTGFSFKSFDKSGNFTIGIDDLSIFPDISYDLIFINRGQGIKINIVFSSNKIEQNKLFFKCLNFPIK